MSCNILTVLPQLGQEFDSAFRSKVILGSSFEQTWDTLIVPSIMYTKVQSQCFLGSEEEDFVSVLP